MSEPISVPTTAKASSLANRNYRRIFGTRIRTSTVVMLAAFIGLLILFGYTTDHYAAVDRRDGINPSSSSMLHQLDTEVTKAPPVTRR